MVYPLAAFLRGVERPFLFLEGRFSFQSSLRASSPIWESEASLARTRERAAKPFAFLRPSLARSREARFGSPKQESLLAGYFQSGRLVRGRPETRNPVVSGSSPSLTFEKKLDFLRVSELA